MGFFKGILRCVHFSCAVMNASVSVAEALFCLLSRQWRVTLAAGTCTAGKGHKRRKGGLTRSGCKRKGWKMVERRKEGAAGRKRVKGRKKVKSRKKKGTGRRKEGGMVIQTRKCALTLRMREEGREERRRGMVEKVLATMLPKQMKVFLVSTLSGLKHSSM